MIRKFIAHTSPGKSRLFALADGAPDHLEAVTSLGADDLHLTDKLVTELNDLLATRNETELATVLEAVPNPVRMAVNQFLKDRCAPQPGAFNLYGPLEVVREAYFLAMDDEFEEYVSGVYMIGLGIRITNEQGEDGRVSWAIQLLSDDVMLPASAELRGWALPEAVKVARTWTSAEAEHNVVREALALADAAGRNGQWVQAGAHRLPERRRGSGELRRLGVRRRRLRRSDPARRGRRRRGVLGALRPGVHGRAAGRKRACARRITPCTASDRLAISANTASPRPRAF